MIMVGSAGMVLAVGVVLFGGSLRESAAAGNGGDKDGKDGAGGPDWRFLLSRPMLLFLLFYVCTSAASSGFVNFSPVAMSQIYGAPLSLTTTALTVFLAAGAFAILPGGFLADWTTRHDLVLVIAFLVLTGCTVLVGAGILPMWSIFGVLIVAGVMRNVVGPARDILVRRAAPAQAIGTAFAFVTTGWMVGNSVTPVLYGWLLDVGSPDAVFYVSAGFTLVAVGTLFFSRQRSL
jgi:predicted MFS family arabinose efflux permease